MDRRDLLRLGGAAALGADLFPDAVVRSTPVAAHAAAERSHKKVFEDAYRTAEALKAPPAVLAKIKAMSEAWDYDYSPEEALQIVFDTYGLKR